MVYNFTSNRGVSTQAKNLESPVSEALLHTIASNLLETAGIDFEFR
jgi:hypothetical protein